MPSSTPLFKSCWSYYAGLFGMGLYIKYYSNKYVTKRLALNRFSKIVWLFCIYICVIIPMLFFCILIVFYRTAPLGIFSLITVSIAEIDDVSSIFAKLGMLSVAVIGCVVIHQVVIMPVVYFITCRKNPLLVYAKGAKSWLVSFSSTSV